MSIAWFVSVNNKFMLQDLFWMVTLVQPFINNQLLCTTYWPSSFLHSTTTKQITNEQEYISCSLCMVLIVLTLNHMVHQVVRISTTWCYRFRCTTCWHLRYKKHKESSLTTLGMEHALWDSSSPSKASSQPLLPATTTTQAQSPASSLTKCGMLTLTCIDEHVGKCTPPRRERVESWWFSREAVSIHCRTAATWVRC